MNEPLNISDKTRTEAHEATMAIVNDIESSVDGQVGRAVVFMLSLTAATTILMSRYGIEPMRYHNLFVDVWGPVIDREKAEREASQKNGEKTKDD